MLPQESKILGKDRNCVYSNSSFCDPCMSKKDISIILQNLETNISSEQHSSIISSGSQSVFTKLFLRLNSEMPKKPMISKFPALVFQTLNWSKLPAWLFASGAQSQLHTWGGLFNKKILNFVPPIGTLIVRTLQQSVYSFHIFKFIFLKKLLIWPLPPGFHSARFSIVKVYENEKSPVFQLISVSSNFKKAKKC